MLRFRKGEITMMQNFLMGLLIAFSFSWAQADNHHPGYPDSFFDWGRGNDGTGYCFEFSYDGYVLNGGHPVPENLCESRNPSHFEWGQASNGFGYCFQFTPNHLVLWQGRPVSNMQCEYTQPSYYAWGRATNGGTYCFQYTPTGLVMNDGRAVSPQYCH
jgi:hypothetical protein